MPLLSTLLSLPRRVKQRLVALSDAALLFLALWLALSIPNGTPFIPPDVPYFALLILPVPVIGVLLLERFMVYNIVTRFTGQRGLRRIALAMLLLAVTWLFLAVVDPSPLEVPATAFVLFWLISTALLTGSRYGFALFVNHQTLRQAPSSGRRKNTLIYGAGDAGNRLANELRHSKDHNIVAFLDDDPTLWSHRVGGIKVRTPGKLRKILARQNIEEVLLALPSTSFNRRHEIANMFKGLPVAVKTVPSISDISAGRMNFSAVVPISYEDLLGTKPSEIEPDLLEAAATGKSIMITGAGGVIGAELARQFLPLKPKSLTLFEHSEPALYNIRNELTATQEPITRHKTEGPQPRAQTPIHAVLGSVTDGQAVNAVIRKHGIDTIYHAAAYKDGRLLAGNPLAAVENNVLGTKVVAETAVKNDVERFVLVSTDRAARPKSIVGATKRLAEVIIANQAAAAGMGTKFCALRFGSLLASSGSILHQISNQISDGGPVTLPHKEYSRRFLPIRDVARLMILASTMADHGEIFALDMGAPVNLDKLARTMIDFAGYEVGDAASGGIPITYGGRIPGDDPTEAVPHQGRVQPTLHPQITRLTNDPSETISADGGAAALELTPAIANIIACIDGGDEAALIAELQALFGPLSRPIT